MIYGGIEKRNLICEMLEDIQTLMDADCMYSVSDLDNFIAYRSGKNIDIKVIEGMPVPPQSPLRYAMDTKTTSTKIVPASVWGTPFRSTATPIVDEYNNVVGCVGIGLSIEKEVKLMDTYHKFSELLLEITDQTQAITNNIEKILSDNTVLIEKMNYTLENTNEINNLIKKARVIAQSTNLLSINSSIEAAHAGAAGKGFAVVAQEIKTVSTNTSKIVYEIGEILEAIKASVNFLSNISISNNEIILEQLGVVQDVKKTVSDMKITSDSYSKYI